MNRTSFLIALGVILLLHSMVRPQSEELPKFEVAGEFTTLERGDFSGRRTDPGFGGRFTYNLNNYIALDSEVNFFLPDEGPPTATQSLFGIKAGKRTKYVGVFAKVRPGFQTNFVVNDREQARLALDVGGVAEFYPNRHVVLRFDAGDVIIPFGNGVVGEGLFAQRLGTTHNLQYSLGVGIRF